MRGSVAALFTLKTRLFSAVFEAATATGLKVFPATDLHVSDKLLHSQPREKPRLVSLMVAGVFNRHLNILIRCGEHGLLQIDGAIR